jgi:hypothetical protein
VSPNGPLRPPGPEAGQSEQGPGPAGGFISPQEAQPDQNAQVLLWVRNIVENARRIGMRYPAAMGEIRDINNAVQRLQQKIIQSQPAPEPMAPPV